MTCIAKGVGAGFLLLGAFWLLPNASFAYSVRPASPPEQQPAAEAPAGTDAAPQNLNNPPLQETPYNFPPKQDPQDRIRRRDIRRRQKGLSVVEREKRNSRPIDREEQRKRVEERIREFSEKKKLLDEKRKGSAAAAPSATPEEDVQRGTGTGGIYLYKSPELERDFPLRKVGDPEEDQEPVPPEKAKIVAKKPPAPANLKARDGSWRVTEANPEIVSRYKKRNLKVTYAVGQKD